MESTDAKQTSSKASTSSRSKSTPSSSAADVSLFDAAGACTSQLHPRITSIMAPVHKNSRVSGCLQVRCPRRVLRRWRSCTAIRSWTRSARACRSEVFPWPTCPVRSPTKLRQQVGVRKILLQSICSSIFISFMFFIAKNCDEGGRSSEEPSQVWEDGRHG